MLDPTLVHVYIAKRHGYCTETLASVMATLVGRTATSGELVGEVGRDVFLSPFMSWQAGTVYGDIDM